MSCSSIRLAGMGMPSGVDLMTASPPEFRTGADQKREEGIVGSENCWPIARGFLTRYRLLLWGSQFCCTCLRRASKRRCISGRWYVGWCQVRVFLADEAFGMYCSCQQHTIARSRRGIVWSSITPNASVISNIEDRFTSRTDCTNYQQ